MIPKIIHYCWFSKNNKPIPKENKQFIEKWKILLPDYEFMLWDNSTFDIYSTNWTKSAFELDKFAFVSDYVRLYVLYKYGGIYLDTDVEVVKSFNPLLNNRFISRLKRYLWKRLWFRSIYRWMFGLIKR